MTRLHVFDMDGTLLHGAASVELSRHLGTYQSANAIEQAWLRGEVTDIGFWQHMLPLWSEVAERDIDAAFEAASWLAGIADVFGDIAARGEHSIVISQSPLFFVQRLRRWGADAAHGSRVEPGRPATEDLLLSIQDKVDITVAALAEYDITTRDCVAYGDSTSDELLFEFLPCTVAVNGNPRIRESAAAIYDGGDLREAYALGRTLLDGLHTAQGIER